MPGISGEEAIARWNKKVYPLVKAGHLDEHRVLSLAVGFFLALGFDRDDSESMALDAKGTDEDEDPDEGEEGEEDEDDEDEEFDEADDDGV